MADVVDTLMPLGPSGAGRLRASCETFGVLEPMAEALRIVENDAARRGITIGFVGDVQAQVRADRPALRQVFVNLLSNAVKYNKDGGHVCLSVRGGERVHSVRRIEFGVAATTFDRAGAHLPQEGTPRRAQRTGLQSAANRPTSS